MKWKAMAMGRGFEDDDRELEAAYKAGYEDAMREVHEGGRYGERGGYSDGPYRRGYGAREGRMLDPYDREDESYGERRGVKGTGPYSRYRR